MLNQRLRERVQKVCASLRVRIPGGEEDLREMAAQAARASAEAYDARHVTEEMLLGRDAPAPSSRVS